MARKNKGGVRAARFQVGDVRGDRKEVFARWWHLADQCTEAANVMFQTWLVWHVQHGTADTIREMRAEWAVFKEKKGPKPEKIDPFPPALSKAMYDAVTHQITGVNSQVLAQLMQSEKQRFMARPATKGAWSYWQQVLLCRERLPQFTNRLPIPIKKSAYTLIDPEDSQKEYAIVSRVNREEPRNGRKVGTSTEDRVELVTRRKNAWRQRILLDRISSGEYTRCGASFVWDDRKRRWCVIISYRLPKLATIAPSSGTAILRPAEDHPWDLEVPGHVYRIGGDGKHIAAIRQQVMMSRLSRQAGYRYAASSNKGHGRKRALAPIVALQRRWRDFVKTANHTTTATVVRILVEKQISQLVYVQPVGARRDEMCLSHAGSGQRECSKWDWHQVLSQLRYKCETHGITVTQERIEECPQEPVLSAMV